MSSQCDCLLDFIPHFAKIAGPLHNLTKTDVEFVWTPECENAFVNLKQLLTTAPVLTFPKFEVPFMLETDASIQGLRQFLFNARRMDLSSL